MQLQHRGWSQALATYFAKKKSCKRDPGLRLSARAHAARACSRRRRTPPPVARPPAAAGGSLRSAHERDRTRRAPRVSGLYSRRGSARCALPPHHASPRFHLCASRPRRSAAFIVRPAAAAAPAAAPATSVICQAGRGGGQLRPRATPTVHDPPSPSPLPRLSRRPSAAPVPPPPTHGCAAAAAQSAAGRGGCPRRLCGSRAGRAELGRGVGRPQAARAQRLHRQRPRHGHGPARRRLGRHGAAGRRRAVQETPQLGAGLPPSRCPPRPVRPTP